MKIYIGFSSPRSPYMLFANAIKLIEKRPFDHAYLRFPEPIFNRYMIFQASGRFVNCMSVDLFLSGNKSIKEYELDLDDVKYSKLWSFILNHLGTPYSIKQIMGIFLMKIFHIHQPFTNLFGEICSKLMAEVCELLGMDIPENLNEVTPSNLDEFLSSISLPCILNPEIIG